MLPVVEVTVIYIDIFCTLDPMTTLPGLAFCLGSIIIVHLTVKRQINRFVYLCQYRFQYSYDKTEQAVYKAR